MFSVASQSLVSLCGVVIKVPCIFLSDLSESAVDPLELEENYVIQKLTMDLPMRYDIVGK